MSEAKAIQKVEPVQAPAVVESESAALISMIERAARDPAVDLDKMERLFLMRDRVVKEAARRAYDTALAAMQPDLPVIEERGTIKIKDVKQSTYALWEDINAQIKPVLQAHGFALTFRIGQPADKISVTAILSHCGGHREETTLTLPLEASGSKNVVQGHGSSVAYGKRYTSGAILNLTSKGEDDDGRAAGKLSGPQPEDIAAKRKELVGLIDEAAADAGWFCEHYSVETLDDLNGKQVAEAIAGLRQRLKMQQKATKK